MGVARIAKTKPRGWRERGRWRRRDEILDLREHVETVAHEQPMGCDQVPTHRHVQVEPGRRPIGLAGRSVVHGDGRGHPDLFHLGALEDDLAGCHGEDERVANNAVKKQWSRDGGCCLSRRREHLRCCAPSEGRLCPSRCLRPQTSGRFPCGGNCPCPRCRRQPTIAALAQVSARLPVA